MKRIDLRFPPRQLYRVAITRPIGYKPYTRTGHLTYNPTKATRLAKKVRESLPPYFHDAAAQVLCAYHGWTEFNSAGYCETCTIEAIFC